jgi:signal transduction histidine kinase
MKLLTRTVRNYVTFSILLLAVSAPLFYFLIHRLLVNKMDEELCEHRIEFNKLAPLLTTDEDIRFFSIINEEFVLTPTVELIKADSLLTISLYNDEEDQVHPYRVLRSGVTIQGKSYKLQIQESMVSTFDLVFAIVATQATLIALLFVGLVFINRKLSKIIWDPFYTILDRLKKYQIDKDISIDLPQSTTAEFRDLSYTVSKLIAKNHEAYQSQKEFTENASHELQTPLAVIKGKIDLLMQTPLSEKQAEHIYVLQDATSRMVRLNRNLLLLAKIENQQFLDQEMMSVVALIERLIQQFYEQIEQKNIEVKVEEPQDFTVKVNSTVIEILFTNLITNAIRYTPTHGHLKISVKPNEVCVSNDGGPLRYPEKIFDRFQRDTGPSSGAGIGLAIVKKICDSNGFKIAYQYVNGMHSFTICF